MARRHITLAFATLLASAAPIGAAAAAPPDTMPEPAAKTAPGDSTHVYRTNPGDTNPGETGRQVPAADTSAPTTPVPMNLPDNATADEVKGEYGIGMAGLIIGTVLIAAIVVGALFIITRRTWSTSH